MNEKFLIFGLDGFSWKFYKKLRKKGLFQSDFSNEDYLDSKLTSTIPSVTGVALPSFMTGMVPLRMSYGYFSDQEKVHDFRKMPEKAFWEYGEIKSCIVNLRCTYKPRSFNGKMIAGDLYTPSEDSEYTYPKKLKERVKGFHENLNNFRNPGNFNSYTDALIRDTKKKLNSFKDLVFNEEFDISLFWDGNMDLLQHFRWGGWEKIESYLKTLEKEIFEIYKETKAENLILMSDHGFDRRSKYNFNINTWLKNKGYLREKKGFLRDKINSVLYEIVNKNKYFQKKAQKYTSSNQKEFPFSKQYPGIDYENTIAQLSTGWWGIELNSNILGEKEYIKIRKEIIEEMNEIKYDGKRVFEKVCESEELYGIPTYEKKQPDIFFVTNPMFKCAPPLQKNLFVKANISDKKRTGHHYNSPYGIFLAFGEDIRKTDAEQKINIYDIAPTILHQLALTIPKEMDGKVHKKIFKKESEPYQKEIKYSENGEKEKLKDTIKGLKL